MASYNPSFTFKEGESHEISVDEYVNKVDKLGGKVIQSKMTVPGWGYLVICFDTEDNMFGLWQEDKNAK